MSSVSPGQPATPAAPDGMSFPHPVVPEPGQWLEIHPDVRWIRMPLPFALNHINLWLLRGPRGWTIVDTGYNSSATRQAWEQLLPHHPDLEQVLVTHYHPDHLGQAGWFAREFGLPVLMTEAEYLTGHAAYEGTSGFGPEGLAALYRCHGLDAERIAAVTARPTGFRNAITPPPTTYRRISHGDVLRLGHHEWRVMVGHGHAPEHASLYCEALGLLISGDMLLPKISTNTSVPATQPETDPVGQFLSAIRAYTTLPADTLVLPSHGLPFRGIEARVQALEAHHRDRLDEVLGACVEPRTAAEIMPVLFRRELDIHQLFFAMGEAIAHLNHLFQHGRVTRTIGPDGVHRFQASRT